MTTDDPQVPSREPKEPEEPELEDDGYELVRLASADNFRDVAGPGYATADGGQLRTGVFFRCNELTLTHEDAASLADLGIACVFDLRSTDEVTAHPDVAVPGAENVHLEIRGIPMSKVTGLEHVEEAEAVMVEVYRAFVEKPETRAGFGELLRRLADAEGAQLFHCTAGKDRTGWAATLLLRLAGVPEETVLADYLLTNTFSSGTRQKYLGLVREHAGESKVEVYDRVMVADEAYLAAADEAVASQFGSLAAYVRDGLGVDDDTRDRLVARLRG